MTLNTTRFLTLFHSSLNADIPMDLSCRKELSFVVLNVNDRFSGIRNSVLSKGYFLSERSSCSMKLKRYCHQSFSVLLRLLSRSLRKESNVFALWASTLSCEVAHFSLVQSKFLLSRKISTKLSSKYEHIELLLLSLLHCRKEATLH